MPTFALDRISRLHPLTACLGSAVTALGFAALLLGFIAVLLGSAAAALAEEPPLVLSREHLGLSGDEIEAAQPQGAAGASSPTAASAPSEAPLVLSLPSSTVAATTQASPPIWDSEFVSSTGAAGTDCAAAPAAAGGGVTGFGQCVELSIRGGAGYDESARVCRALFPGQS